VYLPMGGAGMNAGGIGMIGGSTAGYLGYLI
jgi:hypothetical protein